MRRVINMVIWIETVSHTCRITAEGAVLFIRVSYWIFDTRGVFLDYSVEVMGLGESILTGADENMWTVLEDCSCRVHAKGYSGYSHQTIVKLSLRASE